ncbi:hypothetical protein ACO22_07955 [Paracoccidioides brasiliensis]|uniref:Uncharacterized protein n=1 Tax=Paracoccidioides brasiliensis TaxID=121759 RepID=A0A1D2J392_PARBR|nr:hypothetical protein ACO22_07955 [Paracoccidioides brasiliensis]
MLGQIPRAGGIQTLPHARQLQSSGNNHDAQKRGGELPQQPHKRVAKEQSDNQLEGAEEDDARPAAGSESKLGRQAAGAMAHGHRAEPAPEQIHGGHTKPDGGGGRRLDLRQQISRQIDDGDDRIQRRQRELSDARIDDADTPLMANRDGEARMPDTEGRKSMEHDESVGDTVIDRRQRQHDQRDDHPDVIIRPAGPDPTQVAPQTRPCRDNQRQPRANLYPLDDGRGHHARKPLQQARHAEQQDNGAHKDAGGGDLAWREVLGDGDGGDGFHGLDGQWDAEVEACEDVVEAGEEETGGQGDGVVYGQGGDEGEEGAQVAKGAGDFSERERAQGLQVAGDMAEFGEGKREGEVEAAAAAGHVSVDCGLGRAMDMEGVCLREDVVRQMLDWPVLAATREQPTTREFVRWLSAGGGSARCDAAPAPIRGIDVHRNRQTHTEHQEQSSTAVSEQSSKPVLGWLLNYPTGRFQLQRGVTQYWDWRNLPARCGQSSGATVKAAYEKVQAPDLKREYGAYSVQTGVRESPTPGRELRMAFQWMDQSLVELCAYFPTAIRGSCR